VVAYFVWKELLVVVYVFEAAKKSLFSSVGLMEISASPTPQRRATNDPVSFPPSRGSMERNWGGAAAMYEAIVWKIPAASAPCFLRQGALLHIYIYSRSKKQAYTTYLSA
jgi:hypothetical protein